jgi:Coenzyme PQQ synthesis protein D (PqqD)
VRVAVEDSVVWADVEGELVLLRPETGAYYALNETGADVWRWLHDNPADEEELVDRLVAAYAVERWAADADVRRLLANLAAHGLVVIAP